MLPRETRTGVRTCELKDLTDRDGARRQEIQMCVLASYLQGRKSKWEKRTGACERRSTKHTKETVLFHKDESEL